MASERLRVLAVWLLVGAPVLMAQDPGTGSPTGSIAGRVIDASTGRGIPNAIVQARSRGGSSDNRGTFSDDAGGFRITSLPPGSYEITAKASGYLDSGYGRRRAAGQLISIPIAARQRASGADILMWPPALISGRVLNERGDPVAGVNVHGVPRRSFDRVPPFDSHSGAAAWTNDLGEYELSLGADDYVVFVRVSHVVWPVEAKSTKGGFVQTVGQVSVHGGSSENGRFNLSFDAGLDRPSSWSRENRVTYVTTLYPSATSVDEAQVIRTTAGSVHRYADIRMRVTPHRRITGSAVDQDGTPLAQVVIQFHPDQMALPREALAYSSAIQVMTHDDGTFDMMRIPPGGYMVEAFRRLGDGHVTVSDDAGLWARMRLDIGERDVEDFQVVLKKGVEVTGTVVVDAAHEKSVPSVGLARADGYPAGVAHPARSGQFRITGVRPGPYVVRLQTSTDQWMVSSMTLEDRDIMDRLIEVGDAGMSGLSVTVTDHVTRIQGTATDRKGAPIAGAMIAIFPANSADRTTFGQFPIRVRRLQAGHDGSWRTTGLPPGDYLIAMVDDAQLDRWPDQAVLDELARDAMHLTVIEGSTQAIAVRQRIR
jgi:protocatechuate 3,4-dioxygenase beta subunit